MHSHYMPQALLRALRKRGSAPRVADRDGVPYVEYGHLSGAVLQPAFTDAGLILERMEAAGITHSVLSVTIPGVDWFAEDEAAAVADECNRETAELVKQHPGRLSGLATVPLQFPVQAVEVLTRAVEMGLGGVMIYSNVAGGHLDALERRRFFAAVTEVDVPILLHPTFPLCAPTLAVHGLTDIAGFLFDTTTATLRLISDGIYERHPELKFIVPHAGSLIPYFVGRIDYFASGRPGTFGSITDASSHIRKLYIDSACLSSPALRYAIDFFGVERVMLGSDHPFWPMARAVSTVDELNLSASDRAMIDHENAARLFRIGAPAAGRD